MKNNIVLKRIFDIGVGIFLLLVLCIPFLFISILLYFRIGKPIFFIQSRPGYKGEVFSMYKFRTMSNEKDERGNLLPNEQRIIKIGKILRKTSLDELPELFNVLEGNMSLVGPRPLRVEYLKYYSPEQNRRHEVKPGITGWAQINGRNAISWEEKFKLDVWYVDNRNLWLDIKILFITFLKVIKKEGINSKNESFVEPFRGNN